MNGPISARLLDQRIRNRLMEAIETLAHGPEGVREVGADDYFEHVYDWMHDGIPEPNSAMTKEECAELAGLADMLNEACSQTRPIHDDEELIGTGWPARLAVEAQRVLILFKSRGRFDEDVEELEPAPALPEGSS
jgi:hypothetical protein